MGQKLFFDYRTYGWIGDVSFEETLSFEEILRMIRMPLKPELNFVITDGLAKLDLGNDELIVDTNRGYQPIERKIWSSMRKENRYVRDWTRIKLVDFKGKWLPERIDMDSESKKQKSSRGIELKWISYGESIPPEKVTPEYMQRRLTELKAEMEKTAK